MSPANNLAKGLAELLESLSKSFGSLAGPLAQVGASFGQLTGHVFNVASALGSLLPDLKGLGGSMLAVSNMLSGGFVDMAAKIADLVVPGLGTLAETLLQFPQKMLAAVTPFVEALSPSLLLTFNTQLANLQATVGTAFGDVFNILAPVLDQAASLIQGVMTALRPVIDSIVTMFGTFMIEVVRNFVAEMEMLLPVIELLVNVVRILMSVFELFMLPVRGVIEVLGFLLKVVLLPINAVLGVFAKLMEGINTIFGVLQTVFSTYVEVLTEFVQALFEGLGLGSIFETLEDAIRNVISILLQLIAFAAKFLGADTFLSRLIENLRGAAHAVAAPKDVGIKGIEAFGKEITAAAFIAGGAAGKSQKDLLADAIKQMELIQANQKTFNDFLAEQVDRIVNALSPREAVRQFKEDHPILGGIGQAAVAATGLGPMAGALGF